MEREPMLIKTRNDNDVELNQWDGNTVLVNSIIKTEVQNYQALTTVRFQRYNR